MSDGVNYEPSIGLLKAWANDLPGTLFRNTFLGVPCAQNPIDVQIAHEVIYETQPEVIIECGSLGGGSALLWASHLETCGIDGLVVAIDIEDRMHLARPHALWDRRVRFLHGSTTDPAIVAEVAALAAGRRTMVILDSDHHEAHVRRELDCYAPLVTPGCYLVVQDGWVTELDPSYGPGPLQAIESFLQTDDRFEIDRSRERLIMTGCPSGWLRRTDP